MRSRWLPAALAIAVAGLTVLLIPRHSLPESMRTSIRWFAAVAAAFVWLIVIAAGMRWNQPRHSSRWLAAALGLFMVALSLFVGASRVHESCTARYAGGTVIVGTEHTDLARANIAAGSSTAAEDLVLDAAGRVDAVFTPDSIAACRLQLYLLESVWFPVLAASFGMLLQASVSWRRGVLVPKAVPVAPSAVATPEAVHYDAFLSYRHGGADTEFARQLLIRLEEAGFRIAIDERDFQPQQNYVIEMERCIRQSRYTLAIISGRYLESGNTEEEALLGKVLDLNQRRRRLIPLLIERVELPIWLLGTVGIDFTREDGIVEPFTRLTNVLAARES